MGTRFRQRIKVFPGVHLNVSSGGVSVSVGGPGATINIGKNMRVRGTVGLPGTGLSYQGTLHAGTGNVRNADQTTPLFDAASHALGWTGEPIDNPAPSEPKLQLLTGATWTPEVLMPVQNLIIEAYQERQALDAELDQSYQRIVSERAHLAQVDTWWRRWFSKQHIQNAREALEEAQTVHTHLQDLKHHQGISIRWSVDEGLQKRFVRFSKEMRSIFPRAQAWHLLGITDTVDANRAWLSSSLMHRTRCAVETGHPAFFTPTDDPLYRSAPCITCADGLALYFYPTFILMMRADGFGLVSPEDLDIAVDDMYVAEHDPAYAAVPRDQYTWHYVNKNGTPDQRYTHNPRVPLVNYQRLTLTSPQGMHETFLFADNAYAFASWIGVREWYEALRRYQSLQALPLTPVDWSVRTEPDATYFVAKHEGKEVLGFGFTRHADQFWVCLNTEPLGVEVSSACSFDVWLDDQHLELGNLSGITRRIGKNDAAFWVTPNAEGQDKAHMQHCLDIAKEAFVLIENEGVAKVRLRLALTSPAPFWHAVENYAAVETAK